MKNIYNLYSKNININYKFNNFDFVILNLSNNNQLKSKSTNKCKWFINYLFLSVKFFFVLILIVLNYFFFSLYFLYTSVTKMLLFYYLLIIIVYFLTINFNIFLNKYRFGKFTTSIQRFWKRTNIIFWLIEGFLFLLFFYYFLNSSQEPIFMFDYSSLNNEFSLILNQSIFTLINLGFIIYLCYILLFSLNTTNRLKLFLYLFIINIYLFYVLLSETYQFIYVVSSFTEKIWTFDNKSQIWVLDNDSSLLRLKMQYFTLCLIAKYWHFIFIFFSWFFFFIKSLQLKNISYTLLGYNIQNLIILYILNIGCLVQWLKVYTKKFFENPYSLFFTNYDDQLLNNYFIEIGNVLLSFINFNTEVCIQYIKCVFSLIFGGDDLMYLNIYVFKNKITILY